MLFLEDLYATKRPYPKRHSAGRQPRAQRRDPPLASPEAPRNDAENSTAGAERHERASSIKRNSFFSRRKSTATNSSTESPKRNSSTHSGGGNSQRSSLVDPPVAEGEGSKGKYLFGLHSSKKSGPRKSDPLAKSEADRGRSGHSRGASADSGKAITMTLIDFKLTNYVSTRISWYARALRISPHWIRSLSRATKRS
jgi:hypothetical protein